MADCILLVFFNLFIKSYAIFYLLQYKLSRAALYVPTVSSFWVYVHTISSFWFACIDNKCYIVYMSQRHSAEQHVIYNEVKYFSLGVPLS